MASVGAVSISRAELGHWTAISEHTRGRSGADARSHALNYLIVAAWVRGEARRRAVSVPPGAAGQRVEAESETFVGGRGAFESSLSRSGETLADRRWQIETELLYSRLESTVEANASVAPSAVAAYYRRHRNRFLVPERRFFLSDSRYKNSGQIYRDRARILAGGSFPSHAIHESLSKDEIGRKIVDKGGANRREIERAIFAAPKGKLLGPFKNDPHEFLTLVEVTRIVPARYEALERVAGQIERELKLAAAKSAVARFRATWQARWRAMTRCRPSWTAPACTLGKTADSPLPLTL